MMMLYLNTEMVKRMLFKCRLYDPADLLQAISLDDQINGTI